MLISAALKKFENITNPFVVFKIPGDKTRGNQYTEFLVIICLFIFAFYYRVVGFWDYKNIKCIINLIFSIIIK